MNNELTCKNAPYHFHNTFPVATVLLNLLILVHLDTNTANAMVVHMAPELCETQVRNEKTIFQPTS